MLGDREGGTAQLESAVVAPREALEEGTRDQVPLQWALCQNNLGWALLNLADRIGDTTLGEAVQFLRLALQEPPATPFRWIGLRHSVTSASRCG
jgi:hypothetical protein